MSGDGMSAQRPGPGSPREYRFPRSVEHLTANGLRIIVLPMPARPLASVQLLLPGGAALETASNSGLTAALARLLTEGGERHDADQLVEASELLGAKIGAEAGWESVVIGASLPASRLAGILDLVAEIALAPRVPDREVDRVTALRLAALEQSQASPRARASEALIAEIYGASAAYSRPMGGTRESVAAISRDALMERHALLLGAGVPTLVIAGDEDDPTLEPSMFLKRTIMSSALLVMPKCGHTMNLEDPDAFNRAVLDFVTQVDCGRWTQRIPESLSGAIIAAKEK